MVMNLLLLGMSELERTQFVASAGKWQRNRSLLGVLRITTKLGYSSERHIEALLVSFVVPTIFNLTNAPSRAY